jgi:octaprenyl-diphosphate synthase
MQPSSPGYVPPQFDRDAAARFRSAIQYLKEPLAQVEAAMREQVTSPSELVGLLGDHVLGSGGKRMRPALLLLAAELCGYTGPRRVHMAAAIELLHTATLLHDDVVDLSELRRGQPSANALWGNRRAVLGGDFLYARSSSMIVEDGEADILWIFANTLRKMSEGELLQLERSFDPTITEAHYYAVIERKSAVLLSAATEVGAVVAGVTRAERRHVAEFGRELGVAFQLRDDALDYEDREADLGKRPFDDLREGKVTLPLLLALKRCTPAERDAIATLLKTAARNEQAGEEDSSLDLTPAVDAVARYHGVADTIRRAEEHAARAAQAIAPFPEGRAKQDLLAAAAYSVTRDH